MGTTHCPTPVDPLERNCVWTKQDVFREPINKKTKFDFTNGEKVSQSLQDFVTMSTEKSTIYLLQLELSILEFHSNDRITLLFGP
jgi:hypothetical protein